MENLTSESQEPGRVKIIRMSGFPVFPEDLEKHNKEFNRLFDKADKICKQDMLRLQRKLAKIEKILDKMYPSVREVDECLTRKQWTDLMDKYGNIMVTRHRDTLEHIYVIVDIEGMPGSNGQS